MNRILFLIILAIGMLFTFFHALFPPRMLPVSESLSPYRIDRACILDRDFYIQYLSEDGVVLHSNQREQAKKFQRLSLDWELFITETIAILSMTVAIAACAAIPRLKSKPASEQDASGNRR